ncbi:Wzz/FepE/Etk N-terminal domain-containing protein [Bosea sp. BH3]|uniref:BY-kinase domain-containing protein n=1 Tax=Bosea sp. BH3 TaxID=2871701 RepID=UPI0021CB2411|nr:Wzz/FepE/Etk N-terminal domain-containing protein [Bosea sp. BH3]MCU4181748.1 AAA family ATPase [Bosea sp. BH3]
MLQTVNDPAKGEPIEPGRLRPAPRRAKTHPAVTTPEPVVPDQQFLDVVRVLWRRRRMILTVAVLGAVLAIAVGLSIPPRYTAVAEIAVEPPQRNAAGVRPLPTEEEMIIDTHIARLSSRDQMARVLDSLVPGDAASAQPAPLPVDAGEPIEPASNLDDGWSLAEFARRLEMWSGFGEKRSASLTVRQLEHDSKILQTRRSRLISIAFTSKNPEQAAAVTNRIAEIYVDARNTQKREWMTLELARISERIGGLKEEAENARSAAQVLATLVRRQDELRSEIEFISPDVSVSSFAKAPERPSSSNPLLFILPASLIFAIGACAFGVVRDRLDHGLRSERDVSEALGVPCIGLVPKTARMGAVRRYKHLLKEPFSAYSEAIRATAATLRITAKSRHSKVVLISSSVPMEGKSTLALSLATYLSGVGRRVLLVDLDSRRGSFLAELHAASRTEEGSRDLHFHNRAPADSIRHIADVGLDYLPIQRNSVDPLLFASEHLPRLIRQWRDDYDCVIIDGPALLGAAEARSLPLLADRVLFAVKWAGTKREVARSATRLLREASGLGKEWSEVTTAILTQVDVKRHAQYRFGDAGELTLRYRRYYARGLKAWRSKAPPKGSAPGDQRPPAAPGKPVAFPAE